MRRSWCSQKSGSPPGRARGGACRAGTGKAERAACLWADRDAPRDLAVPAKASERCWIASPAARVGRRAQQLKPLSAGPRGPPETSVRILMIRASRTNPIGANLPTTQSVDQGETGYYVYKADRTAPRSLDSLMKAQPPRPTGLPRRTAVRYQSHPNRPAYCCSAQDSRSWLPSCVVDPRRVEYEPDFVFWHPSDGE